MRFKLLIAGVLALLLGACAPVSKEKPRFLWIDASANFSSYADDADSIATDCKRIAQMGFTDIVVDVRPTCGDVLFKSSVAPALTKVPAWFGGEIGLKQRKADFDYLQAFIDAGHAAGLKVHAGVNMMVGGWRMGSNFITGMVYDHPERKSWCAVDLLPDGTLDYAQIQQDIAEKKPKMVYIQRSRGYSTRPTLTWREIKKICDISKKASPRSIIMLDNCYGEFVEKVEPLSVGVDIMAGSLIKNAGGGIAPTGGYIAGKRELVEMCAYRLTTPGTGKEIGATLGNNRELFMGAYHAPHVTGEALKTAVFASALFEQLGFDTAPRCNDPRGDIIQLIMLGNEDKLCRFCEGIQSGSAVDSFVVPVPSDMPGYESQVIMAAGAFTLGSSIELSADAPMKEPYAVYFQGGLTYPHAKFGILSSLQKIVEKNLIKW